MSEEQQQQQQEQKENLSDQYPRWIGGSILVEKFEDNYEFDALINR